MNRLITVYVTAKRHKKLQHIETCSIMFLMWFKALFLTFQIVQTNTTNKAALFLDSKHGLYVKPVCMCILCLNLQSVDMNRYLHCRCPSFGK